MQQSNQVPQEVSFRALDPADAAGPRKLDGNLALISGVKVMVEVVVGTAELSIEEVFALQDGSVVKLDQLHDAPLHVRLDGKTIADGALVVVGDNFGIRIDRVMEAPGAAST